MDDKIRELAEESVPLAVEILREAIRIPADYVPAYTSRVPTGWGNAMTRAPSTSASTAATRAGSRAGTVK
jgi:hypothetical protein